MFSIMIAFIAVVVCAGLCIVQVLISKRKNYSGFILPIVWFIFSILITYPGMIRVNSFSFWINIGSIPSFVLFIVMNILTAVLLGIKLFFLRKDCATNALNKMVIHDLE